MHENRSSEGPVGLSVEFIMRMAKYVSSFHASQEKNYVLESNYTHQCLSNTWSTLRKLWNIFKIPLTLAISANISGARSASISSASESFEERDHDWKLIFDLSQSVPKLQFSQLPHFSLIITPVFLESI